MRTRSYYQKRQQGIQKRLGQGARTKWRGYAYQPRRQFVPRTMGPFAVSESKYFDTEVSATAIAESTNWTGTELSSGNIAIPQEGSDIDNRIGRKIAVYKVTIRGVIVTTPVDDIATSAIPCPATRLILFVDQQTNGAAAQGEDLMTAPTNATAAMAFSSLQNIANLGRFRVLRDITLRGGMPANIQDSGTTVSATVNDVPFKITYRFKKPLVVRFNSTNGGTIGDVVDNSIHLIGQKSGTGFVSNISYRTRCYYKDA